MKYDSTIGMKPESIKQKKPVTKDHTYVASFIYMKNL